MTHLQPVAYVSSPLHNPVGAPHDSHAKDESRIPMPVSTSAMIISPASIRPLDTTRTDIYNNTPSNPSSPSLNPEFWDSVDLDHQGARDRTPRGARHLIRDLSKRLQTVTTKFRTQDAGSKDPPGGVVPPPSPPKAFRKLNGMMILGLICMAVLLMASLGMLVFFYARCPLSDVLTTRPYVGHTNCIPQLVLHNEQVLIDLDGNFEGGPEFTSPKGLWILSFYNYTNDEKGFRGDLKKVAESLESSIQSQLQGRRYYEVLQALTYSNISAAGRSGHLRLIPNVGLQSLLDNRLKEMAQARDLGRWAEKPLPRSDLEISEMTAGRLPGKCQEKVVVHGLNHLKVKDLLAVSTFDRAADFPTAYVTYTPVATGGLEDGAVGGDEGKNKGGDKVKRSGGIQADLKGKATSSTTDKGRRRKGQGGSGGAQAGQRNSSLALPCNREEVPMEEAAGKLGVFWLEDIVNAQSEQLFTLEFDVEQVFALDWCNRNISHCVTTACSDPSACPTAPPEGPTPDSATSSALLSGAAARLPTIYSPSLKRFGFLWTSSPKVSQQAPNPHPTQTMTENHLARISSTTSSKTESTPHPPAPNTTANSSSMLPVTNSSTSAMASTSGNKHSKLPPATSSPADSLSPHGTTTITGATSSVAHSPSNPTTSSSSHAADHTTHPQDSVPLTFAQLAPILPSASRYEDLQDPEDSDQQAQFDDATEYTESGYSTAFFEEPTDQNAGTVSLFEGDTTQLLGADAMTNSNRPQHPSTAALREDLEVQESRPTASRFDETGHQDSEPTMGMNEEKGNQESGLSASRFEAAPMRTNWDPSYDGSDDTSFIPRDAYGIKEQGATGRRHRHHHRHHHYPAGDSGSGGAGGDGGGSSGSSRLHRTQSSRHHSSRHRRSGESRNWFQGDELLHDVGESDPDSDNAGDVKRGGADGWHNNERDASSASWRGSSRGGRRGDSSSSSSSSHRQKGRRSSDSSDWAIFGPDSNTAVQAQADEDPGDKEGPESTRYSDSWPAYRARKGNSEGEDETPDARSDLGVDEDEREYPKQRHSTRAKNQEPFPTVLRGLRAEDDDDPPLSPSSASPPSLPASVFLVIPELLPDPRCAFCPSSAPPSDCQTFLGIELHYYKYTPGNASSPTYFTTFEYNIHTDGSLNKAMARVDIHCAADGLAFRKAPVDLAAAAYMPLQLVSGVYQCRLPLCKSILQKMAVIFAGVSGVYVVVGTVLVVLCAGRKKTPLKGLELDDSFWENYTPIYRDSA